MFSILCNKKRSILKGRGNPQPIPPLRRISFKPRLVKLSSFLQLKSFLILHKFFFFFFFLPFSLSFVLLLFPMIVSFKKKKVIPCLVFPLLGLLIHIFSTEGEGPCAHACVYEQPHSSTIMFCMSFLMMFWPSS